MSILRLTMILTLLSSFAWAAIPNNKAPVGGTFVTNLRGEPTTIHPITQTDLYSQQSTGYMSDGLLTRDEETLDWKPRLAEKWEVSKDYKVFTYYLRKNAVFHDGTPVTAEDVKFSFDAIFDKSYDAAHLRPYYEGLSKIEIVDPYTIRIYAKDTYFQNFSVFSTTTIIPKHVYGDPKKSKSMNLTFVAAGPYKLEKFERGQRMVLKRFDKWYGWSDPMWKGYSNFDTIIFKFINDDNVALEALKKGDIDYTEMRPDIYMTKTEGAPWGEKVNKYQVENSGPKPYRFIGWNMKRELFKDRDVRVALAHLMNQEEMIKKFRYGMSLPGTGPYHRYSEYAPKNMKPIEYSPEKAKALLTKAGWKDSDKNGVLDKMIDGKLTEFKFTLMHANKDTEKYWTYYKEDLKKAGVDMEIKFLEWNSFSKLVDDKNFDAVAMGWGGVLEWDPKQIWHSTSADKGGSNFISYKNLDVDKMIDKARMEPDRPKRVTLLKKVYEAVAKDAPYVFMMNDKYFLYANAKRIQKPADTFKYGIGADTWWIAP